MGCNKDSKEKTMIDYFSASMADKIDTGIYDTLTRGHKNVIYGGDDEQKMKGESKMAKTKEEPVVELTGQTRIFRGLTLKTAGANGLTLWIEGVGQFTLPADVLPPDYDTGSYDFYGTCEIAFKFTGK